MRVLITGATGMVGSSLINTCPSWANIYIPPRNDLRECRISIPSSVDLVIHAAGKVGGILSNQSNQYDYLLDNAMMGINVVRSARFYGVKLLNLGSSCMYPNGLDLLTEDLLLSGDLEPSNEGYALAKTLVQKLCQFTGEDFKTIVPCNLFGKGDKFDERAHLIPAIIAKMVNNPPTVSIWGDGQSRREFLYVDDFARMVWECVEKFDELPQTMNIGVGEDHTILEYYEMVKAALGATSEFTFDLSKPTGMKRKLLDVSKSAALGIKSKIPLEQGIKETIQWYKERVCTR